MTKWTTELIGDLKGKRIIITGGASGIGLAAGKGACIKGSRAGYCCKEHSQRGEGGSKDQGISQGCRCGGDAP